MEVDFTIFRRNARRSVIISLCSLVIPFGLGAAVAVGVYDNFIDTDRVTFSHFLLFIAVAMAITAFPVLSRILTELSLLQTDVGVTVLAAGVANDVSTSFVLGHLFAYTQSAYLQGGGLESARAGGRVGQFRRRRHRRLRPPLRSWMVSLAGLRGQTPPRGDCTQVRQLRERSFKLFHGCHNSVHSGQFVR